MHKPIPHRDIPYPQSQPPDRRRAALVVAPILAVAATLFGVAVWPNPSLANAAPSSPSGPIAIVATAAELSSPNAVASPLIRQAAPELALAQAPPASFEELVEQLVSQGIHTAELAQQDEIEAAKACDLQVRQLFSELLVRFQDAGERSLALLASLPEADPLAGLDASPEVRGHTRLVVLQLILGTELGRRHEAAVAAADRSRIDPLVQALLDVMPQALTTATIGGDVLANRPYLRLVHEASVLGLVRLAGEQTFSRPIATKLLLTLWDNLQQSGERSSEELAHLAMMLLTDADPSHRTAACRQLLVDARYRSLVMSWLRERNDLAVASEIAGLAARELPPADALAILRELGPILPASPGAYVVLAHRAPELLTDAYRELLAGNIQPGMRRDLIAGVGMTPSKMGTEIAQFALQNDPSPDVRMQAVFALTANAAAEQAEQALQQVLDDPAVAQDTNRLAAVVFALQNLEVGGHTNAVDRVGQRLRSLPLSEASRQSLEAILARSLPGGQTSLPAPPPR